VATSLISTRNENVVLPVAAAFFLLDIIEQKISETQRVKTPAITIQVFTLCIAIALSAYYFDAN